MKKLSLILALCAALVACSKPEANTNTAGNANAAENPGAASNTTDATGNIAAAKPTPTIDPNFQATFPFKDFPAVDAYAKPGEVVLVPSYLWLQQANVYGVDKTTMIWYAQKMVAPEREMSEVEFMGEKKRVPNAYIVAIPPGQTAKKGDILLTWWQSGSGMNRAIVVDDTVPTEPVVRYLDIEYDNPAKSKDGKTGIGQMEEKLAPNTFVKINNPMEPGTVVAVQDGANMKKAQVIRVAGDHVFTTSPSGKIAVYDKAACTPLPVKSAAKAGETVKGVWAAMWIKEGTVTRVDPRIGRVFIKFGSDTKETAVPFGDVMK